MRSLALRLAPRLSNYWGRRAVFHADLCLGCRLQPGRQGINASPVVDDDRARDLRVPRPSSPSLARVETIIIEDHVLMLLLVFVVLVLGL
jgi:hypothetical protein